MMHNHILCYTDGSYIDGKEVGGFGAIITSNDDMDIQISGCIKDLSSAFRAELIAVTEATKFILNTVDTLTGYVTILTDCQNIIHTYEHIDRLANNNWLKNSGEPVKHIDLWSIIYDFSSIFTMKIKWIPGNSKIYEHVRVDEMAKESARRLAYSKTKQEKRIMNTTKSTDEDELQREAIYPTVKRLEPSNFHERNKPVKVAPFTIERVNGKYVRVPVKP